MLDYSSEADQNSLENPKLSKYTSEANQQMNMTNMYILDKEIREIK